MTENVKGIDPAFWICLIFLWSKGTDQKVLIATLHCIDKELAFSDMETDILLHPLDKWHLYSRFVLKKERIEDENKKRSRLMSLLRSAGVLKTIDSGRFCTEPQCLNKKKQHC